MKDLSFKISLIIVSVDRSQELQECVASIEKAHEYFKDVTIELLVVIQKSGQLKSIQARYPGIIKIYYIGSMGLSVARNFAIEKSTGDYLVFLDDDAMVKEDFLEILSNSILEASAVAFCGKIIDPVTKVPFSELFYENDKKSLSWKDFKYFMGSAHVLKKSIIDVMGGFDEQFGAGSKYPAAEESDMFFKLKRRGEEVVYLPELVFYHPVNDETSDIKRFNYAYAVGAMLTKQIFLDRKHVFFYLQTIAEILIKSFIRALQVIFFLKTIEVKNTRFRYKSVLTGTIKGISDWIKNNSSKNAR